MVIEVIKKEGESASSLLRRFTREVQKSGLQKIARGLRFRQKQKNKRAVRASALRREEIRRMYTRLSKLGLLEKEE